MANNKLSFGWGHININVRDLDRSIVFYEQLGFELFIPAIPYLGLDTTAEHQNLPDGAATALGITHGARGRACIMQLGDGFPKLDLTEFVGLDQNTPLTNADTGLVRICLTSEDLPRDVARLKADGVEFLSEPQEGHGALADIAVCKDPDGTLIELLQVYLDRWQSILNPT
ncbi:MAG: VOC family protein [Parvibaculaceae bacterium]